MLYESQLILFEHRTSIDGPSNELSVYEKLRKCLSEEEIDWLTKYANSSLNYFAYEAFNEDQLNFLINTLNIFVEVNQLVSFKMKKDFLEYQLSLR